MKTRESVNFTLKIETIRGVRELAKEEGRSFSNMVQRILEEFFKKKKE